MQFSSRSRSAMVALYFVVLAVLVYRIASLDAWSPMRFLVLAAFLATAGPDRLRNPAPTSLVLGLGLFFGLSVAVTYLPDLWFSIAYGLNHGKNYLFNANDALRALPGNDAAFLWSHRLATFDALMAWVYENGFDLVVWLPVVRSLVAFDVAKMARYALSAHLVQFPMIMPFFATIRADEVWSVLGHADRLGRGWSEEVRLDLGANCFPSMHTSVAFAVMLLALRERSSAFRRLMFSYGAAIIISTMYMEVHWVVDVIAGLGLGYAAVKVVDRLWPDRDAGLRAEASTTGLGL